MRPPEPWPLRHLVLRTPRLELRPDDDAGLDELVDEAYHGVHPPGEMPFLDPWTDADPAYLGRGMLQYFWSQRGALEPAKWRLHFLVRVEGRVVGVQSVTGVDFPVTREVSTGSWIGMRHQGRGIGTEMRTAVLLFAFDHLGARRARSGAFADNVASHRVSAKLGYRRDGTFTHARRGERVEEIRLLLTPETFVRPDWPLRVDGVEGCAGLLGAW
ncbi:GNAT family N-acetyltransferase [Pseudonocardia acidicola]|uniref:GNAT family N-acetyltransferase n=1 Tax=Pseudonocardia acidicola TaxID=2724939 RepID=A0ABX1SI83_9PSEU|nr:GNAT family protein [Pseudonocardia acidicola]NMI01291.1 GNAT family N-acetyltransferase [Pseudonocardia acidicola]